MFYIDSHCHIDFENFDEDRDAVVERAKAAGVHYLINIGCESKTNQKVFENSQNYKNVFFSSGIHPSDVEAESYAVFEQIRTFAKHKKMLAVGEIGLDYYKYDNDRALQKYFFEQAIDTAHELKKPIVIHNRDAHEDVYDILKEKQVSEIGGVMHCFAGSADYASSIIELGLHISLTGVITFKNADYDEIIRRIPIERLMLETDSPFLSPHPFRGKRNEPERIPLIAQKIADVKKVSLETVMEETTKNCISFFKMEGLLSEDV